MRRLRWPTSTTISIGHRIWYLQVVASNIPHHLVRIVWSVVGGRSWQCKWFEDWKVLIWSIVAVYVGNCQDSESGSHGSAPRLQPSHSFSRRNHMVRGLGESIPIKLLTAWVEKNPIHSNGTGIPCLFAHFRTHSHTFESVVGRPLLISKRFPSQWVYQSERPSSSVTPSFWCCWFIAESYYAYAFVMSGTCDSESKYWQLPMIWQPEELTDYIQAAWVDAGTTGHFFRQCYPTLMLCTYHWHCQLVPSEPKPKYCDLAHSNFSSSWLSGVVRGLRTCTVKIQILEGVSTLSSRRIGFQTLELFSRTAER